MVKSRKITSVYFILALAIILITFFLNNNSHEPDYKMMTLKNFKDSCYSYKYQKVCHETRDISITNSMTFTIEDRLRGLYMVYRSSVNKFGLWSLLPDDFDWNDIYGEYVSKVIEAEDLGEFYMVLQSFVSHLGDGHSGVVLPPTIKMYYSPIYAVLIDGRVIVWATDKEQSGIPVGSEVIRINGVSAMEYLRLFYGHLTNIQPILAKESQIVNDFFWRSTIRKDIEIKIKLPDGNTSYHILTFMCKEPDIDYVMPRLNYGNISDHYEYSTNTFWTQQHRYNILRIRVNHFLDNNFIKEIRDYLSKSLDADAVIIDARGHSGGNSALGYHLLSHFIDAFELNHLIYIIDGHKIDSRQTNASLHSYLNSQSVKLYELPIVILTDHRAGSAGEDFVSMAKNTDRFTIIGTNTMGATGQLANISLPGGGNLFLTTQRTITRDGIDITNNGIAPDIWVEQTYEDFLSGTDTQLKVAIEYLRKVFILRD